MTANVIQDRLAPARRLAEFTQGLSYEDLPDHVIDFAKGLIVKMAAAELGGATTVSARKLARLTASRGLRAEAGVAGFGFKTSLWDAVLQNVFTAHCSELEDVAHSRGGLSWDVTVIPLALSVGEHGHRSGRELIALVAAGLEVQYRTSEPFDAVPAGFVLPPQAAMGCAAAAAKGLQLDAEPIMHAMGIALSTSAMAEVSMGSDAHFFESALHAYQGVAAADMAAAGMTGNPDLTSFSGLRASAVELDGLTAGLGEQWWFAETWIKKYPLCFLVHRQVDALLELIADADVGYDDIAHVEVTTGPSDVSCDRPHPRTVGDLMFSIQHAVGAAMLDGAIELTAVDEKAADDPRYVAARAKVSVVIDESAARDFQMGVPTTVTVTTTDGRRLVRERMNARGAPDEPLDRQELDAIFRRYASGTLSESALDDLLGTIWTIEDLDDVASLADTLTNAGTLAATTR
jgi:2-methylcitrate dehydratase PrpD